jgi:hypothetical protein
VNRRSRRIRPYPAYPGTLDLPYRGISGAGIYCHLTLAAEILSALTQTEIACYGPMKRPIFAPFRSSLVKCSPCTKQSVTRRTANGDRGRHTAPAQYFNEGLFYVRIGKASAKRFEYWPASARIWQPTGVLRFACTARWLAAARTH